MKRKSTGILAVLMLALMLLPCSGALAKIPDKPDGNIYVTDAANVITAEDAETISAYGAALEDATGVQFACVAVNFLDGETADDYAYELFNTWGIGSAQTNDGLLLLLSTGDREYQVTTGTGLEKRIKTSALLDAVDSAALDDFANDDFSQGLCNAYIALCDLTAEAYGVSLSFPEAEPAAGSADASVSDGGTERYAQPEKSGSGGGIVVAVIIILIILLIVMASARKRTHRRWGFWGPVIVPPVRTNRAQQVRRSPGYTAPRTAPRTPVGSSIPRTGQNMGTGYAPRTSPTVRPSQGRSVSGSATTGPSRVSTPTRPSSSFGGGTTRGAGGGRSFSTLFGSASRSSSSSSTTRSRSTAPKSSGFRSFGGSRSGSFSGRSFGGGSSRGGGGGRKF